MAARTEGYQQPEPLRSSPQSKVIYKTPNILYIWFSGCLVFLTRLQLCSAKHTAYSIAVTLIIHVEAYFQQITASA